MSIEMASRIRTVHMFLVMPSPGINYFLSKHLDQMMLSSPLSLESSPTSWKRIPWSGSGCWSSIFTDRMCSARTSPTLAAMGAGVLPNIVGLYIYIHIYIYRERETKYLQIISPRIHCRQVFVSQVNRWLWKVFPKNQKSNPGCGV